MHKPRQPRVPRKPRIIGTPVKNLVVPSHSKPAPPVHPTNTAEHCPAGWYTRAMVRDKMKATEAQMRRWILLGYLQSEKLNNGGWSLYSEAQVQGLANRISDGSIDKNIETEDLDEDISNGKLPFSGDDVTRVFSLIGEGMTLIQIQIKTQIHPYVLRAIKKEYDYLSESITVPKLILDQMNRIPLPGTFPLRSAADILDCMKSAADDLAKDRTCIDCKTHPCAEQCVACLRKRLSPPPAVTVTVQGPAPDTRTARSEETATAAE